MVVLYVPIGSLAKLENENIWKQRDIIISSNESSILLEFIIK